MPTILPIREFLAFIVPGALLLGLAIYFFEVAVADLSDSAVHGAAAALIVSYVLGFLCHLTGQGCTLGLYRVLRDPITSARDAFPVGFRGRLNRALLAHWGEEIHREVATEFWLSWRMIQRKEHAGMDYFFTVVSRFNFAGSMCLPAMFLVVVGIAKADAGWIATCAGIVLLAASLAYLHQYRGRFARAIYHTWYACFVEAPAPEAAKATE